MKRIEATHFIEVYRTDGAIKTMYNTRMQPIYYLEETLSYSTSLGMVTVAIFKIKAK